MDKKQFGPSNLDRRVHLYAHRRYSNIAPLAEQLTYGTHQRIELSLGDALPQNLAIDATQSLKLCFETPTVAIQQSPSLLGR